MYLYLYRGMIEITKFNYESLCISCNFVCLFVSSNIYWKPMMSYIHCAEETVKTIKSHSSLSIIIV